MQKRVVWGICALVLGVLAAGIPLKAQSESTNKAPLYVYVSDWAVPRAQLASLPRFWPGRF